MSDQLVMCERRPRRKREVFRSWKAALTMGSLLSRLESRSYR